MSLVTKRSAVWDFFTKVNKNKVVCNLCKREFKYAGNTSNLRDHILRKHPSSAENLKQHNDENSTSVSLKKPKQTMLTFERKPINLTAAEQASIDQSVFRFLLL